MEGPTSGPVVVLSYAFSGAPRIQRMLAAGADLACTYGTGIMAQCANAAQESRQQAGRDDPAWPQPEMPVSPEPIQAQVMQILAGAGKSRWCELATGYAGAAEAFGRVFPDAAFVCVHRSCQDVIRAGTRVSPWVLQRQALGPYLLSYGGNTVAALAAYWVHSAERLLAFERANPHSARRIRYEDMTGGATAALGAIRAWLRLESASSSAAFPAWPEPAESAQSVTWSRELPVPSDLIPPPLRDRIAGLHAELGYPS
jgi:hypothetical protein